MSGSATIKKLRTVHTTIMHAFDKVLALSNVSNAKEVSAQVENIKKYITRINRDFPLVIASLRENIHAYERKEHELQQSLQEVLFILKEYNSIGKSEKHKDMMKALDPIVRIIVPVIEMGIFLKGSIQDTLVPIEGYKKSERLLKLVNITIEDGIMDWVMAEKKVQVLPENEMVADDFVTEGNNSYICIPMLVHTEAVGILIIYSEIIKDRLSRWHKELLLAIAEQTGIAIRNAQVRRKLKESVRMLNEFRRLSAESERNVTAREW